LDADESLRCEKMLTESFGNSRAEATARLMLFDGNNNIHIFGDFNDFFSSIGLTA